MVVSRLTQFFLVFLEREMQQLYMEREKGRSNKTGKRPIDESYQFERERERERECKSR